jgi:DNA polymerase V
LQLADVCNVSAVFPLTTSPPPLPLPFCVSRVCAGFPSPAEDYQEPPIDLNKELVKHPLSTFFVRAAGDSMIEAGISPDDLLVVDKAAPVASGHIVVAAINGAFCVKHFYRDGQSIALHSANQKYQPIEITPDDEFEVWGRVLFIIKKA